MAGKQEIVECVAQTGMTKKQATEAVDAVFGCISDSLANGDKVAVPGFGTFQISERSERAGRNPKTGEAVALSGKYVPHFKPGKDLRERVNASRHFPIKS